MWELHTYGGGDFLRLIFNGLASIFGNDNYGVAIIIATLLGFMAMLVRAAFHRGQMNLQWFLAVVMLYQVALVPKVDIQIIDHVTPHESATVGNIPMGIAAPATIVSHFSYWLTTSFETVFSMPNEIRYTGNGLLFANELVRKSTAMRITTPHIAANFSEFWKTCVFTDIMLGLYPIERMLKTPDLMAFFAENVSRVRTFPYTPYRGDTQPLVCREGIANQMADDLEFEIENATDIYGARVYNNAETRDEAALQFSGTMPLALEFMTGIATSNANIITQNALSNSFKRAMIEQAIDVDSAAAVQDIALARAEQERKASFVVMAKLAHKFLPILQHLFESIIYAFSPVVMLLAMTPLVAKVMINYLRMLLWVNLWPPIYAILHFAMSYFSARAGSAAVVDTGETFTTGLNMMTHVELGQVMSEYAAIAGYLSVSIPLIAWMAVSSSGAMMAGLAGRFLQGYETPVSSAANEAAAGNFSLANVNYDNHKAFQYTSAPLFDTDTAKTRDESGTTSTWHTRGVTMEQAQHSSGFSMDTMETQRSAMQQSLESSKSRLETSKYDLANSNVEVARNAMALSNQVSELQGHSTTTTNQSGVGDDMSKSSLENSVRNWAKSQSQDISEQQVLGIAATLGAKIGIGGGGNNIGAGAGMTYQNTSSERNSDIEKLATEFASSKNFSARVGTFSQNALSGAAQESNTAVESVSDSLTKSIDRQKSESQSYQEALSQVEKQSEVVSKMEETASMIKVNNLESVFEDVRQRGGDSRDFNEQLYDAQRPGNVGDTARQELAPTPKFYPVSPNSDLDLDTLKTMKQNQQLERPEQGEDVDIQVLEDKLEEGQKKIDQKTMGEKSKHRENTEKINDAIH